MKTKIRLIIKTFYFASCLSLVVTSYSKGDNLDSEPTETMPELRWVEGNYSGTYERTIESYSGNSKNPTEKSKKEVKASVTLNPDTTLTIIIRGGVNSTMDHYDFTVSNGNAHIKCGKYSFDKQSQCMYYSEQVAGGGNNNYQQLWIYFTAYKDIE